MTKEIELKLAVEPAIAARIARLPPLKAAARGRAVTRRLRTTYFDTEDHALGAAGLSVRLRKAGRGWTQTVKSEPDTVGGLSERDEVETHVRAPALDVDGLLASPAGALLSDANHAARLQPVFETEFQRTVRPLAIGTDTECELCVDRGAIRAGTREAPISEIELELTRGSADDLVSFALDLARYVEFRLEPDSKAARGYALRRGTAAHPVKFTATRLDAELDAVAAVCALARASMNQLLANAPGIRDSRGRRDPEYVHQARVALRRMRLALRLLSRLCDDPRIAAVAPRLRELAMDLGAARDLDVMTIELLPQIDAALGQHPGIRRFASRVRRQRTRANRRASEVVASQSFTNALLEFTAIVLDPHGARGEPVTSFARDVLRRRHKAIMRSVTKLETLDFEALHALRKAIKKQRYAVDCFRSLWPHKAVARYTKALSGLQDSLGTANDVITLEAHAEHSRKSIRTPDDIEAVGMIRGWAIARANDQRARLNAGWSKFIKAPRFWREAPR